MLLALSIKNLAIIENLELSLDAGFTVLSGETGAGKSILVDALSLVLGGRASSEMVRTGAESAEIEAMFDLSHNPAARAWVASAGLDAPGEDRVVVRRQIARTGKNRLWIAGRMETTARLAELGRMLIDIYGQHEHQDLLDAERHRALLDQFADVAGKMGPYREAYGEWRRKGDEMAALDLDERQKRERMDLLKFRLSEIESAKVTAGEDERLETEREVLRHGETLKSAGEEGASYLYDSDDPVVGGLRRLVSTLTDAAAHDPWFRGPAEQVEQAAALLEDAALELGRRAERIEADPERLLWIEDRIHELKRLKRKYEGGLDEVLAAAEGARRELETLAHREERLAELAREVEAAKARAEKAARALTSARVAAGEELARRVVAELASLGMEKTRFTARVSPLPSGLSPGGADEVGFYLSPNPGEEVKPLEKIASGGELSRIMLALRVLLAREAGPATLVFDEVDVGIGGKVAEAVGRRMKLLARSHQVLCVTHLPQIAALADRQVQVVKRQTRERTMVEVSQLSAEQRIEELARMLGGHDITATTRAHAAEMLSGGAKQDFFNRRDAETRRRVKK